MKSYKLKLRAPDNYYHDYSRVIMINAFNVLMGKVTLPNKIKITQPQESSVDEIIAPQEYVLMFDGGSRGNPGICGAGACLFYESKEIWASSKFVSEQNTNNFAEYWGLLIGLKQAQSMNIKNLIVKGDSNLIINQFTNKAKVKSERLLPLYNECRDILKHFSKIDFKHVRRNLNKRADELANMAMDDHLQSKVR